MTDMKEIKDLIKKAEGMGATVNVTLDADAELEGREVYDTVQVIGLKGIGSHPMSLIAAAERLREIKNE